ncbi:DUF3006 domain-containing protein [Fictibacillus halophilus]|uniref:DUF3006 domain-containing protein n=1 Tax=Fictibacillus halophilus TaxID=1610490 RepID=UPI003637FFF7
MPKKGIVDRIEGDLAVVECSNKILAIPLSKLPREVKVGDVIVFHHDSSITIDEKETKARKDKITKLMNELWED